MKKININNKYSNKSMRKLSHAHVTAISILFFSILLFFSTDEAFSIHFIFSIHILNNLLYILQIPAGSVNREVLYKQQVKYHLALLVIFPWLLTLSHIQWKILFVTFYFSHCTLVSSFTTGKWKDLRIHNPYVL